MAMSYGKDLGDISVLKEYNTLRQKRKNFITLVTTFIFYLFKKKSKSLNNIINLITQNLNKTSSKKIMTILARGY